MVANDKWKLNIGTSTLSEDRNYLKKPFSIAKQVAIERGILPSFNYAGSQIWSDKSKRAATVLPDV
jgi:hypothetical protein